MQVQTYSTKYFPSPQNNINLTVTETNLLSETTISQAQPAFICLNSAILTVE